MQWLSVAQGLDRVLPRRLLASLANAALAVRGSDDRSFAVDSAGHWLNRQPEATFATPDVSTAHYATIRGLVMDSWFPLFTPGDGDTVIDVGAGVGEDAVVFSKLVGPRGRVISIEAHPGTFSCLQQTISLSGLTNVTALHCAVAGKDGTLSISDGPSHLANSVVGTKSGLTVPARGLDSLFAELGIADVAMLKMNIEGAERFAVPGMRSSAPRVRNVAIACHDFIADGGGDEANRTRAFVREELQGLGFALLDRGGTMPPWVRDTVYARRP